MSRLARSVTRYLNAQIAAGAQAVQLFDSWVGCLGPDDYRRYVLPYTRAIIDGIAPGVPVLNFATGNPALVPLLAKAGGHVIGVDSARALGRCLAGDRRRPRSSGQSRPARALVRARRDPPACEGNT